MKLYTRTIINEIIYKSCQEIYLYFKSKLSQIKLNNKNTNFYK